MNAHSNLTELQKAAAACQAGVLLVIYGHFTSSDFKAWLWPCNFFHSDSARRRRIGSTSNGQD